MIPTNAVLWQKILEFQFDKPGQEYGFTTRLALENNWTIYFAKTAILEYKKFMYLAAVCDQMVSPSHIVDIVWHQHLIYTDSYRNFCSVLGKQIEHIPATHHLSERGKFSSALQFTEEAYRKNFGNLPPEFWTHRTMTESLHLQHRPFKNLQMWFGVWMLCTVVLFFLLRPVFLYLEGFSFILVFAILLSVVLFFSWMYIENQTEILAKKLGSALVISNLALPELVFLRDKNKGMVLNYTNILLEKGALNIDKNHIFLVDKNLGTDLFEQTVLGQLNLKSGMDFKTFFEKVSTSKPFHQVRSSMISLVKYIQDSVEYRTIFYPIYFAISIVFSIGICRLILGFLRDKPIAFLIALLVFSIVVVIKILPYWLNAYVSKALVQHHRDFLLENKKHEDPTLSKEYTYFLTGAVAISLTSFAGMSFQRKIMAQGGTENGSVGCGSGCGSSCGGGSCGGGCGGCGGGGD